MRTTLICMVLAAASMACDSDKSGGDAAASASASKPTVTVVVRKVTLQKTISRRAAAGAKDGESWTAFDGQVYAVVSTDIVHNQCADGDEVSMKQASLALSADKTVEATGGGADPDSLCLLCEAKKSAECSGGQSPMRPFTFVFSVPKDADVATAKLKYRGSEALLSVAEISDLRADESVEGDIQVLRDQIAKLRKKLENTTSRPAGKLIEGEIEELERKIGVLEKKKAH